MRVFPVHIYAPLIVVHFKVARMKNACLPLRLLAFPQLNMPERRTYAGKQFARAERLSNVIVRARLLRHNLVPLPCACGNH